MTQKAKRTTCFNIPHEKAIDTGPNEHRSTGSSGDTRATRTRHPEQAIDNLASPQKPKSPHDEKQYRKPKARKFAVKEVKHKSPWNSFKRVYECDLAGKGVVVAMKSRPESLHFLKTFPGDDLDELLHRLHFIQHDNIAYTNECFATPDGLFALSDFMPLTLGHIVACQHFPDLTQLNAIMTQILNGLCYLEIQGLQHASLNSSDILMNINGRIKIGRLENCVPRTKKTSDHTQRVGSIMMELLQKYVKDDDKVGIDDFKRWPADSIPVGTYPLSEQASGTHR